MRQTWLAVPSLLLLCGCDMIDPVAAYRAAAQKLRITLDRVEPNLDLAFPLEQSRLRLRLTLGVENPSDLRLRTRSIGGRVSLDANGTSRSIGAVDAPKGIDLPAGGRAPVVVDLSIAYADLKEAYGPLRSVVLDGRAATWRLDGQMTLDVMGVAVSVPIRSSKHVGK
jgi:LEA14-like dessication related protein